MHPMSKFDPEAAGFVLLRDYRMAPDVAVFEYRNHAVVDGQYDVLRINAYLTTSSDFVTIWYGLIEPSMVEGLFDLPIKDLDFQSMYCTPLFRGYIEDQRDAVVILDALRLKGYGAPQVLRGAPHDLRCELLS
jgi:hypothetical protein